MPTALDLPRINTELIEVPASDGSHRVRGAGEGPMSPKNVFSAKHPTERTDWPSKDNAPMAAATTAAGVDIPNDE